MYKDELEKRRALQKKFFRAYLKSPNKTAICWALQKKHRELAFESSRMYYRTDGSTMKPYRKIYNRRDRHFAKKFIRRDGDTENFGGVRRLAWWMFD